MSSLIYTEVESHRASLRERVRVVGLIWRTSGEPDVPFGDRWSARRLALRTYVRPSARVSTYIVNRNG